MYIYILVGGFNHLEKIVNGKDAIPYIVGNIRCSKPPTSIYIYITSLIPKETDPSYV